MHRLLLKFSSFKLFILKWLSNRQWGWRRQALTQGVTQALTQGVRGRSLLLPLMLLCWSLTLGWGLARATTPPLPAASATTATAAVPPAIGTVDAVPQQFQLGQQVYLQNCATCHLAAPPAILPTQSWAYIVQNAQHYGVQITPLQDPSRLILWNYLRNYSRPAIQGETLPTRFEASRPFKALHPRVDLPSPASFGSCLTCHPAALEFNFRRLTPAWDNAP